MEALNEKNVSYLPYFDTFSIQLRPYINVAKKRYGL